MFAKDSDEEAEWIAVVGLNAVPGIGPRTCHALRDAFGSLAAAWQSPVADLGRVPGVGPVLGQRIVDARKSQWARHEIERCRATGIELIPDFHADYPRLLAEIPDPPTLLYVEGQRQPQDALAVAIVGTRHATQYGLRQAEKLAASLARAGITVVSGLARGIDAAAHRSALAAGGRTCAVLAGSLREIYPPEHKELASQIRHQGWLISESSLDAKPRRGCFPRRNRVISGLSLGVVVVEASERSGALITARHALEQGRDVFAVPGRVDQRNSRGCHRLLRDGAKLVEGASDVLEELGPLVELLPDGNGLTVGRPAELQLNDQERAVLQVIETEPTPIDQVVLRSGLTVARVLSTLSVLEMRHLVQRLAANRVMRIA